MLLTVYLKKGKDEKVAQGREGKAVMRETCHGKRKITSFFFCSFTLTTQVMGTVLEVFIIMRCIIKGIIKSKKETLE